MLRIILNLALALALALIGPVAQAADSPANPIIEHVVKALREQGQSDPSAKAIVDALNRIVAILYRDGKYAEATAVAQAAQKYAEAALGPEHPTTLTSVNNLAELYRKQGRYGEAESLYRRALEASERVLGREHPDTLISVNNLAALYQAQGRYEEAEPLFRRVREASERVLGSGHPQTLFSVNNLAALYQARGRYGDAEPLYRRALEARERVLGREHPDTLTSVNDLASLYRTQGRYGEAESLFRRALEARERVLGTDHPDTLGSVNNLAMLYRAQGRYGEAESLFRRALKASERVLGPEHPQTLTSVNNLAMLYQAQGRYGEAEPLFRRVLEVFERVLGREHPDTLTSVNNLAMLYQAQGRYGEAEPLFRRALEARERVLGLEHPDTLQSVNNLAQLYQAQGRYGEAEPLFRRASEVFERVLGREHPHTLIGINNLAMLYQAQGRYGDAEPLFRRALEARERVLGHEHPDTLTSVNNLAALYDAQGRYGRAESLYRRAQEVSERVLGPEHPNTLASVNNLAALFKAQGRYGEAEPLFRRALKARERVLGHEHPDTLTSVNNLAALYDSQGRYGRAEPLYRRAQEVSERVLGREHPQTLGTQLNLSLTLINQDKLPAALRELRQLDGRLRGFVGLQLATTGRERVKRDLLVTQSSLQDVAFTLAVQHPGTDTAALAADLLLRWKRLASEEETLVARLARTSRDPRVVELAQQIRTARAELSRLVNLPEPDAKAIRTQREALEGSETALAGLSRAFQGQLASRSVVWESVQGALPPGTALLDLRAYNPVDFKTGKSGELHWLALLMPADPGEGPALRVMDLGAVKDSQPALAALRAGKDEAAKQAYAALFGKLDTVLAAYPTLFLAPDGALDLIAFARLVLPDGRRWIERQALRQMRSGRDLLPGPPSGGATGMVVFGGVDYEHFTGTDTAPKAEAQPSRPEGELLALNQRLRSEHGGFSPLANSGPEANNVARYYWDYDNRQAQVYEKTAASEARLKALSPPPRVLHLATHGFFLADKGEYGERPLTLSGLALAGANRGLEGQRDQASRDDGILYAIEAQDLNLEGTRLVTLSACDTGKGEVDYSEGVYGLVRAFQIAGAENVLMTLWPLNDPLAREFMADFYRRWFDPGKYPHPAQALRATQLDWLHSDDARKRDPTYWAPYVLVERR